MKNNSLGKWIKIILPIALGLGLVYYSYSSTSEEERLLIWQNMKEANFNWVLVSLLMGLASHLSRAWRWNYLLEPMGYRVSLLKGFMLVMLSYFANLGIPRSGEFFRATALNTYNKVPFEKGFGTIVTERIIDLLMLVVVLALTFMVQSNQLFELISSGGKNVGMLLGLGALALVALGISIRLFQKSTHPFALKFTAFLKGLQEGINSVLHMKKKWHFLGHTLFIWACYIGMFWVIQYAIVDLREIRFNEILVGFIAGTFAMTTTNGGIGLYPIAISSSLSLFEIAKVQGDAYGWIMWIAQTLLVVLLGVLSFLFIPFVKDNNPENGKD